MTLAAMLHSILNTIGPSPKDYKPIQAKTMLCRIHELVFEELVRLEPKGRPLAPNLTIRPPWFNDVQFASSVRQSELLHVLPGNGTMRALCGENARSYRAPHKDGKYTICGICAAEYDSHA